jgi:DNA-binding MarR family transcriptional regulator
MARLLKVSDEAGRATSGRHAVRPVASKPGRNQASNSADKSPARVAQSKSRSRSRSRTLDADQPALTVSRPELLVRGSDRQFRELVHGLFSFLASHEEIRAGHARFIGLAGIEYTVLISIAHLGQGGDVSVSAVAQHLRLTGAFITNVCQRLVSLGLIDKAPDRKDRRRVRLTLTAEGRGRLDKLAPTQRQINDIEFGCLTRAEFESLSGMIERLIVSGEQAAALQRYLQSHLEK